MIATIARSGAILLGTLAALGRAAPVDYLSERPERMLFVQTGWGELGINVCAHPHGRPGPPLQIGEKKYERGLGHHAPGEIVVELGGEYLRFEADVGLQPLPGGEGSVVFQVFVDDVKRFDSGVVRAGEAARAAAVDVAGAQELRLVVTDAGDGITCDCANWAEARLIRDPAARSAFPRDAFDVARFARIVTSDPARTDGSRSNRVQEYRAEDVYLETDLTPDAQGVYRVPAVGGAGTIGLRWIERRAVRSLAIEFADGSDRPAIEKTRLQFWHGESPYQGGWKPLKGELAAEGDRWVFRVEGKDNPDLRGGTWKVRWIFPVGEKPVAVRRLTAFTPIRPAEADLRIEFDAARHSAPAAIDIYNGEIIEPAAAAGQTHLRLDTARPTPLKLRWCKRRPWQAERTVLRFQLPEGGFGVAVDDVVERKAVYVPVYGTLVSTADAGLDLAAYRRQIEGRETILQQVRRMPDQTFARAMERVHRKEQDLQPTMLSLACDNHKFIVHRDGTTQFLSPTTRPAPPDTHSYPLEFRPSFGSGRHEGLTRHLEGGWYPAPTATVKEGGLVYRMCSFVTPFGEDTVRRDNPWLHARPLYVAAITVENTGDKPAEALLTLAFAVNPKDKSRQPTLRHDAGRVTVEVDGALMAVYDAREVPGAKIDMRSNEHALTFTLPRGGKAACPVYIPAWPMKPAPQEAEALLRDADRFDRFKAYWDGVLASAMRIRVPDPLLMDVIRASQVHCLIAARNEEDGRRVSPWIASVSYGPLESESNSIIRGMGCLGHHEFARRSLDFFIHRYDPAGFLTTGYTLMGTGWHLWTLGEHYRLTADATWLRGVAPKVAGVCAWITKQREKTLAVPAGMPRPIEAGLMPPGIGADWNAFAYHFCLNGYYCAGLRDAAAALRDIGFAGAEAFLANAEDFHREIVRAYRAVQAQMPVYPLRNGTSVPGYPGQLLPGPTGPFFPGEDGNRSWCYDVELGAHHLIPQGILPADGPDAAWIMDHMEDVQFLADGWFDFPAAESQKDWFNLGGFSKVQPYYTRNGEICARRDDVKPFVRTYFNTLASLLSRENLSLQEHFRGVGAWNKTHETGYFLHQTRCMLVLERGEELWLAPLVTNNWLKDGLVIEVRNAPTRFGPVGYRIESATARGVIDATIEPPTRSTPAAVVLRLRHPDGKPIRSVTVNGKDHHDFDAGRECIRIEPGRETIRLRATY